MMKPGRLLMLMRRIAWRPEIAEIVARTSPDSRILEIGAATGEFLYELRKHGRPNIFGVEFSADAAHVAQSRYQLDIRVGQLEDFDISANSIDLVLMRHVLEHLPDPSRTMKTIARILKPRGYCIFTIPNIDSHTVRIFGEDWYGYQIPRHFFLFPRHTLVRLLTMAGLRMERLIYHAAPNIWIEAFGSGLPDAGIRRLRGWCAIPILSLWQPLLLSARSRRFFVRAASSG